MMSSLSTLQKLTRYKAWANDLTFEAVAKLPDGEALKERKSCFKSILHTLAHNFVVDDLFKGHLEGQPHGYSTRRPENVAPLEELWQATRFLDKWYIESVDRWREEDLPKAIAFKFLNGQEGVMTREEIILHLVNHNNYHRGFVSEMMYQIPVTPPTTDLTAYLCP